MRTALTTILATMAIICANKAIAISDNWPQSNDFILFTSTAQSVPYIPSYPTAPETSVIYVVDGHKNIRAPWEAVDIIPGAFDYVNIGYPVAVSHDKTMVAYYEPSHALPFEIGGLRIKNIETGSMITWMIGVNGHYDFSGDDTMLVYLGYDDTLWTMTIDGNEKNQLLVDDGTGSYEPVFCWDAAWSPDGDTIACTLGGIWLIEDINCNVDAECTGESFTQVTSPPGLHFETDPSWSPDSDYIAVMRWEGSGDPFPSSIETYNILEGTQPWNVFVYDVDADDEHRVTDYVASDMTSAWLPVFSDDGVGSDLAFVVTELDWEEEFWPFHYFDWCPVADLYYIESPWNENGGQLWDAVLWTDRIWNQPTIHEAYDCERLGWEDTHMAGHFRGFDW